MIVENQRISDDMLCAKIRFFIDLNGLVSSFSISCNKLIKENADKSYFELCDFFTSIGFRKQSESFTNSFNDESRFVNSLCKVDIVRAKSKIMEAFQNKGCSNITIMINSRLNVSSLPFDVKKQFMRLSVPKKQKKSHKIKMPSIKSSWILFLVLILMYIGIPTYSLFSENKETEVDALLGSETTHIEYIYICTGPQSKSYHKDDECYGLQKCSADIEEITLDEAKKQNRKPCRYCCK